MRLNNQVFRSLILDLKPTQDSSLESLAMEVNRGNHKITVYAHQSDGYEMELEDFGFMSGTDWKQCEPTPEQRQILEDRLVKHLADLQD